LIWIGDIARLAVNTIRRVNFQSRRAFFVDHFVNGGWTKILARISVFGHALISANVRLSYDEMARLIFFMTRSGMINVRQPIES
jgi:hypothetical protein